MNNMLPYYIKSTKDHLNENHLLFATYLKERNISFVQEFLFHKFHVEQVAAFKLGTKPRRFAADFALCEHKILYEIEGGIFTNGRHVRPMGFMGDCEKYNLATSLGYQVYRIPTPWFKGKEVKRIFELLDHII